MIDQIYSYREMCEIENQQTLQRGMNFRINQNYSLVLMSQRTGAPYADKILDDGITIEYQGHDEPRVHYEINPKTLDKPTKTQFGKLNQNGKFVEAVQKYRQEGLGPEKVKVYEKIIPGVWSLKGLFDLIDYNVKNDGIRNVFVFRLKLSETQEIQTDDHIDLSHTRLISSNIKKQVWQRDEGKCVICGSTTNLHFDHDLPFSKGGTSLTEKNIRLLCAKCNLSKSDKIE